MTSATSCPLPAATRKAVAGGRRLPAVEENATNERPWRNKVCLVMAVNDGGAPPILAQKRYTQRSAFTPESLLRETRRQKRIAASSIPEICVLDPDGGIVRSLLARGEARLESGWACYHTQLYCFSRGGIDFGIVGCAVGASFAVLIAEEMFASSCKLLISVTSSGQIVPIRPPLYFSHKSGKSPSCVYVTNQMGRVDGDFEKGEADGSHDALQLIAIAADRLRSRLLP
jgi:hypothetical protein